MKTTAYKSISKTTLAIAVYAFALITSNVKAQDSYRIKTGDLTETTSKLTRYEVNEQNVAQFQKALTAYVTASISSKENIMPKLFMNKTKQMFYG